MIEETWKSSSPFLSCTEPMPASFCPGRPGELAIGGSRAPRRDPVRGSVRRRGGYAPLPGPRRLRSPGSQKRDPVPRIISLSLLSSGGRGSSFPEIVRISRGCWVQRGLLPSANGYKILSARRLKSDDETGAERERGKAGIVTRDAERGSSGVSRRTPPGIPSREERLAAPPGDRRSPRRDPPSALAGRLD